MYVSIPVFNMSFHIFTQCYFVQMIPDMPYYGYFIYIYIFIILNAPTFCPNCTIVDAFRICIIKIDSLVLFAPVSS